LEGFQLHFAFSLLGKPLFGKNASGQDFVFALQGARGAVAFLGLFKLGLDGVSAFSEAHIPPSRSVTARLRDMEPPLVPARDAPSRSKLKLRLSAGTARPPIDAICERWAGFSNAKPLGCLFSVMGLFLCDDVRWTTRREARRLDDGNDGKDAH
jgi:hypothetical protein